MRNKSILSVLMFVAAIVWLGGLSMPRALGVTDNVVYQGSFPASTTSGMTHAILTINGTQRDLLIYRPSTAQSLPLLIFFDGTGSDFASIAANDGYFRDFADNWNTIIAVPAQRVMSYGDWDNHSSGTPYFETAVGESTSSAASSNPDTNPDLLFTRAIIKEASVAYGADLTRVYVNGFSNGAFFSYFVAATLNDKIAAFAETGGGLVLSNTTYGDPTPCAPTASSAATGAVRSCAAAGWTAGLCSTAGAMARPIAPGSVSSVPPGFMEANDDDTTVPWAHTCNLANALPVSSNYQVRIVHSGIGHGMNDDYLNNSWNFMKKFSTNTVTQTGENNCAASVSSGLVVHIPIVTYGGANYWADLQYNSADSTLTVANAGIVSDMSSYGSCMASTLSSDLKLHIPVIILNGSSYWADLQYSGSVFVVTGSGANGNSATASGRWMMGYYAGYQRDMYPVSAIDWSGVTHIAVAFYLPKNDGTLDETLFLDATNGPALARSIVAAAHQNNRKAIASIGGADADCSSSAANQLTCGMHSRWVSAASDSTRATFVTNLKKLITDYGYDGLDLDWEPIQADDAAAVKALVAALRTALPTTILTMPVGYTTVSASEDLSLYSQLAGQMDQINLMTYGMAGAYSGWKSWHSSALYQQDSATPTSVESSVKAYLKAGVPAAKLGVGVGFYGLCYTLPVTAPLQTLGTSSIAADDSTMTYAQIMTTYYSASAYHYDSTAKAPYLSFASATGTAGCSYISYEDEQSIADKGAYVKAQGLGGAIVWTINQGYYNSQSPLLVALRNAILQ